MAALDALIAGYRRFRTDGYDRERERWSRLAEGQSPRVMVIACSDSRVDPSIIFDVSPGEIFVVRNIANLVPPFEIGGGRHGVSAALEFAVTVLEVEGIMVLGHGQCGGVEASLSRRFEGAPPGNGGFIAHWVDLLDEARDRVVASGVDEETARRTLEKDAVRVSLTNLRTFAAIAEREKAGRLKLHGAWFAVRHGVLELLDEETGAFAPA
jgi:carbonic anhydrase